MKYTHRYLARITLEAATPLCVGSGETGLLSDALVQRDHHGFPMIQGSSLAGVLRHAIATATCQEETKDETKEEDEDIPSLSKDWESFFGFQRKTITKEEEKEEGEGSKLAVSAAYLLFPDGKVAEGGTRDYEKYLSNFQNLPTRPHVRINHKGVADQEDGGLFEQELIYKGGRFLFEMEVRGSAAEEEQWEMILAQLAHPNFRLGQGTRKGYGKLKLLSCRSRVFDLRQEKDFTDYLNFNPSLNAPQDNILVETKPQELSPTSDKSKMLKYQLKLQTDLAFLFLFGSGYGDAQVNQKPLSERVLSYTEQGFEFTEHTVIPASSIKGALRHRTCFYYNQEMKVFADHNVDPKEVTETANAAIYQLFGAEEETVHGKAQRGKVIIDDLHEKQLPEKIVNHVAIDRFTGGAMNGALFSEKVTQQKTLELEIFLDETGVGTAVITAFEKALKDICKGLLPLGGMTTKGHGIFQGKLFKNKEEQTL